MKSLTTVPVNWNDKIHVIGISQRTKIYPLYLDMTYERNYVYLNRFINIHLEYITCFKLYKSENYSSDYIACMFYSSIGKYVGFIVNTKLILT